MSISEIEDNGLPKQWEYIKLGDIAGTQSGGTPSRRQSEFFDGNIPWVKSGELGDRVVTETEERITEFAIEKSSAKLFPVGTLCIALYGATVGKLGILGIEAATNQAVCGIFLPKEVKTWYAYYYLLSIRKQLIDLGKGGAQSNISSEIIKDIKFPIAPLNEQERIVAKIEELFSKLDTGIAALERVQANLKRYRAAVLKAAVEGKLTEEWRKQNPNTEPASKLLQRILKERRQKWESEQLEKHQKSGKTPPKDWQSKYKEPTAPDTANLPDLPDGWCWARCEQVCEFITKGTTPSANKLNSEKSTIPFVKVNNLTFSGYLDFDSNPTFIDVETHTGFLERSILYPDDVLMNIVGPPLGKVSIVPKIFPEWNMNQAIAVYRTIDGLERRYLALCLMTDSILFWALSRTKTTVGQVNLTLEICRDLPIPLPPIQEQLQIVSEVDKLLSETEFARKITTNSIIRSSRLRQSILKQAFSGKLVPQDPNDEPARVLLQRIQAEKGNTIKTQPAKRQRKKVNDEN